MKSYYDENNPNYGIVPGQSPSAAANILAILHSAFRHRDNYAITVRQKSPTGKRTQFFVRYSEPTTDETIETMTLTVVAV